MTVNNDDINEDHVIDEITEVNQRCNKQPQKKSMDSNNINHSNSNECTNIDINNGTFNVGSAILELTASDDGVDDDDDHRCDLDIDNNNDEPKQRHLLQQRKQQETGSIRNDIRNNGNDNNSVENMDHVHQHESPSSTAGRTSVMDKLGKQQPHHASTVSYSLGGAGLVNSIDFRIESDGIDRDDMDDNGKMMSSTIGQDQHGPQQEPSLLQETKPSADVTFSAEDSTTMDGNEEVNKPSLQPHQSVTSMTPSENDRRFASSHRIHIYQWIGLLILNVAIIFIITTSILLSGNVANSTDDNNVNTNTNNNDLDNTDGLEPYQGNWTVRDFPQISQHFVMIYVPVENCSTGGTDSLPNLYYTIQCGPNQTITTPDDANNKTRVEMSQRPTAAIELEASPQRGTCIRTQVNVLTCNAAVTQDVVIFLTCGTSNETTELDDPNDDNSSLPPLLTVQTQPVTGLSCSTDIDQHNESFYDHNEEATYMTSVESKSHTNVAWISTNLFCNNSILSNILDPWNCLSNSNMITIDDPTGTLGNWTYCLSTNARKEEEEMNHTNVTIIPSMKVMDGYNKSLYQEICPYMEKYTPPNLRYYFGISSTIMGRLIIS